MHDSIRKWLTGKAMIVLDKRFYEDPVTYYYYAFMGKDERTHSISFIVNVDKIIPLSNRKTNPEVKLLEGFSDTRMKERSIDEILDGALESFPSRDEWAKNATRPKTVEDLRQMLVTVTRGSVQKIYQVQSENFQVYNVKVLSLNQVLVEFHFNGISYLPVLLTLGGTTAIRERDFGVHTQEFKQFVEDLVRNLGKVVWVHE